MIDQELKKIIDNSPSTVRNSIGIRIIKFVTRLLGLVLVIVGAGLVFNSYFEKTFIETVMKINLNKYNMHIDYYSQIVRLLGVSFMVIGGLFLFMTYLGKLILKRNNYIYKLQIWLYEQEKQQKEEENN